MVLSARSAVLVPALVVPDEQTWTMSGTDSVEHDLEPVYAAVRVRHVAMAEALPEPLAEPLARYLDDVPSSVPRPALPHGHDAHADHEHEHHGDHGGHEHHESHDHDDMMAIVGEPSADGLVMEPLELRFGPIGTPLPGGLVADVTLDGDVVEKCEVGALLIPDEASGIPDPLAPQAWRVAIDAAQEAQAGLAVPPSDRWTASRAWRSSVP